MIFSEQLQCLHHLGVGTRGTLLGWAASLMPHVSYCGCNLVTFSVGVAAPVLLVRVAQSRRPLV
jgi:hypothetical protein